MSDALKEENARLESKIEELHLKLEKKEKELWQKKEQLEELFVELNAEKRKHQGDSRSAHEIGREYYSFFTADVQDALESVQGKEERNEAREQLCSIFQAIYSAVSRYVLKQTTEKLNGMFELQGDVNEAAANDVTRAYARLLSAANLTGRHPDTKIRSEIHSEVQKMVAKPSSIPLDVQNQFAAQAIDIAWGLVTAVPPLIASCDECTFCDDLHEQHPSWDDKCLTDYELKYIRPVLYANSLGAVTQKGSVRNAKPEAAAKRPDVIYSLTGFKDWENLAFYLGMPQAKIVDILRSSSTEPIREVIEYWFETAKPSPTWSKLVSALELCIEHHGVILENGVKVHTKGRVQLGANAEIDGDCFFFKEGSAVGVIKFLEPMNPLLNYYEYLIVNRGQEACIAVGVGERAYPLDQQPGWNQNSCGYHADDGNLYHESGGGSAFGPTCTDGDRMGCGVDFITNCSSDCVIVFFTKNGKQVGNVVRMKKPKHGLYPLIGLHSRGEKVKYLGHWHRVPDRDQGTRPTLPELLSFKCTDGRVINIPEKIETNNIQFSTLLLGYGHPWAPFLWGGSELANTRTLKKWLTGRGKQPVTWTTLVEVLRDCQLSTLASDIEAVKCPERPVSEVSNEASHKTRDSFSSRDEYARFVKNNIAVGQMVRCCESYERVSLGDIGKVTKLDNDGLHDLNVQAEWQHLGRTYWVRYSNCELLTFFKPGDKVRVKRSVTRPEYGWGSVSYHSIGLVRSFEGTDVCVDFPEHKKWNGLISEMEIVPGIHPLHWCDGCGMHPIEGPRYHCRGCANFDFCQSCFYKGQSHNHPFERINDKGQPAVYVGSPWDQIVKNLTVSSNKSQVDKLRDGIQSTCWKSDGSRGKHWIRLEIQPKIFLEELAIEVDPSDGNYMPEVVVILAGDSVGDMKELNKVSISSSSRESVLLSKAIKYYAVIQIMVQKCKDDGIDTKVHGIKVIGRVET